MGNNAPINMESAPGDTPDISGREIPEEGSQEALKDNAAEAAAKQVPPVTEEKVVIEEKEFVIVSDLPNMKEKLEHVPVELRERVSKLKRDDIALSGSPLDPAAYHAYIQAEKKIREIARKKARAELDFSTIEKKDV